jgi:hypothetical protein
MSVTPIRLPFPGERVVGLSPQPAAPVTDWNRRLNLFTGRALSATALIAEQNGQTGRLALRGQMVSPGVVLGLEAGIERNDPKHSIQIGGGYGVCATGEDVCVSAAGRVALNDVPVYATAALLDGAAAGALGALADRRLGPTLGELVAKSVAVPKAGILLLQPAQVDQLVNFNPADPCEQDPGSQAFADEQLLDGVRVVYYAWPDEWLELPAPGDRWRNRLAYAIFDREAANGSDQVMPWEEIGLPIGLVGVDDTYTPLFIDRYAVVRQGGQPKRRALLVPGSGYPFLWQARIQQFAGHVTDLAAAAAPVVLDAVALAKEFCYLPPAGLLPNVALGLRNTADAKAAGSTSRVTGTRFFPGSFIVRSVPAPMEQLDLLAQSCGPLDALDTFAPAEVTIVVPVPQIWYEPDLLEVLVIDPIFQTTVDEFVYQRSLWLRRRLDVRGYYAALIGSATGVAPTFPSPDPDAIDAGETPAASEIDPNLPSFTTAELTYGTTTVIFDAIMKPTVDAVVALKTALNGMPGVGNDVPQLDTLGLAKFADLLQSRADAADDHIDLGFLRVQTDIYRTRQKMLSTEAATRLAVSPALASIAAGISALATKDDIQTFLQKAKNLLNQPTPPAGPPPPPPPPPSALFLSRSIVPLSTAGFRVAPAITLTQEARAATLTGTTQFFAAGAAFNPGDVTNQRPIVGGGYNLRTTSVVERLQDPPTAEVKNFTVASKYAAISNFRTLGIGVSDISIPGFKDANGAETSFTFGAITDKILGDVLAGAHDPIPDHPSESDVFAAGVRAMENTVDLLRRLEARVLVYREAATLCRTTLDSVNGNAAAAAARLQVIANNLGQSRHDVAFARALMAEEAGRIAGINARRDQIVTNQVKFLAYFRPRTVEARNDLPFRAIDPGVTAQAVPACMARNLAAPDELRAYVNLMREAPLNWFIYVPPLLDKLDRIDVLHSVVQNSKLRASFKLAQTSLSLLQTTSGPLGAEIMRVYSARQQIMTVNRTATAQLDLTTFAGTTWTASRDRALDFLSIGDLVDLGHYHPEVPRVSAAEIESILKVAACLYSDFSAVLPVIRLDWAQRLLQLGATLNFANLGSLPNWNQVPVLERKEMQALVDWLFSRINPGQPDAVSHMNDLIRVAILLASHAPVADIIAGAVIQPTTISVGSRINLSADLSRVHLGMHVLMYQGATSVARGVVEDLSDGVATTRVLIAPAAGATLSSGAKVHFAAPDAFDRNPLTAGLL